MLKRKNVIALSNLYNIAATTVIGAVLSMLMYPFDSNATPLTLVAAALCIAGALSLVRKNPLNFLLTAAGSVLYGVIFFERQFYGAVALNVIFTVGSLWAFWKWVQTEGSESSTRNAITTNKVGAKIARILTPPESITWGNKRSILILGAIVVFLYVHSLIFLDILGSQYLAFNALVLSLSIVGQWLVSYELNASWVFFNALSISGLLFYGLVTRDYVMAAQYILFLANGLYGAWRWSHDNKGKETLPPQTPEGLVAEVAEEASGTIL